MIDLYKDILRAVEDLSTCLYTSEVFSELLGKVQAAVRAATPFPSPPNADGHADRLPEPGRIREPQTLGCRARQADRGILLQRLTYIIQVRCAEFDRVDDSDTRQDLLLVKDVTSKRRGISG